MKVGVVGGGVFGLAAAIELQARGNKVTLFERGPIPHPMATSTDVSKGIRRTWYGNGGPYVDLVERAAHTWREWEEQFGVPIFHQVGGLKIMRSMDPGSPMYENLRYLESRGADIKILERKKAMSRFPQFVLRENEFALYDKWSGYIESSRAVELMANKARDEGVAILDNTPVTGVDEDPSGALVSTHNGPQRFDKAVIASGVWSGGLVPQVGKHLLVTLREMLLIEVQNPDMFRHEVMPVWSDDPDTAGWYGFPLMREGIVKISIEGIGEIVHPDVARSGSQEFHDEAMEYLRWRIPEMGRGRGKERKACLYCATPDDHFVIDWAPGTESLLVATGGSGHGFKFGASIGPVIADAVEDIENPFGQYFRIGDRFNIPEQTRSVVDSRGYAIPEQDSLN